MAKAQVEAAAARTAQTRAEAGQQAAEYTSAEAQSIVSSCGPNSPISAPRTGPNATCCAPSTANNLVDEIASTRHS